MTDKKELLKEEQTMSAPPNKDMLKCVGSALLYAFTSTIIVTVNKSVLSIYKFPSVLFLSLSQLVITVFITQLCKALRIVSFPNFCLSSVRKVMPLPILYMLNMILGLGSTQNLSIPMFTVLRRFTVIFTMIGEIVLLKKKFSPITVLTVMAMVLGVMIASVGDLAFDGFDYLLIFTNDLLTAAYGIYIKKINDAQTLGKFGLMFYNSLVSIPFTLCLFLMSGDLDRVVNFEGWNDPWFCFEFVLCCLLGYILIYSAILCTALCGALTQNVVGVLKNTVLTYAGMLYGGDYIFSWVNFIGITISALGGIVYSAVSFSGVGDYKPKPKAMSGEFKA